MMRRAPLTLLLLLAAMPALADDLPSFTLTTDTPAYCAQLAKQVGDRHSTIPDVQRLLAEGHDMCDHGEVRGGIKRLRRALVILHHRKAPKDVPPSKPAAPKALPAPPP
jgi:hypothetical protein